MSSLLFIVRRELVNDFKETLRKPGKLILYILLIALVVGMLALGAVNGTAPREEQAPVEWFHGILFAFLTMFYVISVQKGLTSGDAIFDMCDVNFLFVSPLKPGSVLLYGLLRLAKTSFFAGFFILFQASTLANFGIGVSGVFLLFFLFMLTVMTLTLLSLILYVLTNGNPRRKLLVKIGAAAVYAPVALYFAYAFFTLGDLTAAGMQTFTSPFFYGVPFSGWTTAGAMAFLRGDMAQGAVWIGLLVACGACLLVFLRKSRAEYYEDVLVATETAFEKKRAAQEGDLQGASGNAGQVRVKSTGLRGKGASTLFYRHLRETFRENRFGFFRVSTLITFATILAFSLFVKESGMLLMTMQVLMWMQIFMISMGKGLRELYMPYIYLIPASPFKKLLWSNLETVFKTLLESALFFILPGILWGESPLMILGVAAVYTLFSLLLIGINYLFMRWTGVQLSQGMTLVLYFLAVALFLLPGLIPALILGFTMGDIGVLLALLLLAAWELVAALLCFALSKDVLHRCDMPGTQPKKD